MIHDCAVTQTLNDIVVPLEAAGDLVINQVYVPMTIAGVCMTTTVEATRVIVYQLGSVTSGGGAAYVDTAFTFVKTIVGPTTGTITLAQLGVPADSSGVAVWLDAASATPGFATAYPCGQPQPLIGTAAWTSDTPSTTLVAGVATSPAGLCLFVSDGASVDVSIDGYYRVGAVATATSPPQVRYTASPAPGFVATTPTRVLDTRAAGLALTGGLSHRLDLSSYVPAEYDRGGDERDGNEPSAAGFVTVYPCDGAQPETSSLNFEAGQTVPNLVTVDAGSTLEVCFFASVSTHLLADLSGYYLFGGGNGFAPSPPVRMFDTRNIVSPIIGPAKVPGHVSSDFDISTFVPADASAVVFNLTATDVRNPGFVTVYPCGQQPPDASNLNVLPGQTVPNLVTVSLSSYKHVCVFTTTPLNLIAGSRRLVLALWQRQGSSHSSRHDGTTLSPTTRPSCPPVSSPRSRSNRLSPTPRRWSSTLRQPK